MKLEVDGMNEARNATSVICSAYDSFFEAEKKIADFLIEHKAEAAGMTVGSWAGQPDQRRYGVTVLPPLWV